MKAIESGADALGISGAKSMIDSFNGTMASLDFEGKSQEEISAMISGKISADLNSIVKSIMPSINDFAIPGEEAIVTFQRLGFQLEYVQTHLSLVNQSFNVIGTRAIELSDIMVQSAGGIDTFHSAMTSFKDIFYTDLENIGMETSLLATEFDRLKVTMPQSNEGFRDLMEGLDLTTESGAKLYGKLLPLAEAFDETVGAIQRNIASLREAQQAYAEPVKITLDVIRKDIGNFKSVGNDAIESSISAWVAQQQAIAEAREESRVSRDASQVAYQNKAIDASNALRRAILSMRDTVYKSFRKLQDFTDVQYKSNLLTAINNKDYKNVASAFSDYAKSLGDTAVDKEQFYRGIAEANALVQSIDAPAQRTPIEQTAVATGQSAVYLADMRRIDEEAYKLYEELIEQNGTMLPEEISYEQANVIKLTEVASSAVQIVEAVSTGNKSILDALSKLISVQQATADATQTQANISAERLIIDRNVRIA